MADDASNPGDEAGEAPPEEKLLQLDPKQIVEGLSLLQRTADGRSYAYTNCNLSAKEEKIQELGEHLRPYKHLTNIDLSENDLRDISEVAHMEGLLQLKASTNAITSITFFEENPQALQHLQFLDMSVNQIKDIAGLPQPMLRKVVLSENQIADLSKFGGHSRLRVLDLKKNQLTTCLNLCDMPNLIELYLNENQIADFNGMKDLPKLKKLDLNTNKLTNLDHLPALPSLEHFDFQANTIEAPADGGLSKLVIYADTLKTVMAAGNPFADALGDGIAKEVLLTVPGVTLVGETEITDEERKAAKELAKEREAEEAARKKAEEDKANGVNPEGEDEEGADD